MNNKIIAVIVLSIALAISSQAQRVPSAGVGGGTDSIKKVGYLPPKKSLIRQFRSGKFSFTAAFAGKPEINSDEEDFLGLKIHVTSFGINPYEDRSLVKIYEFPTEINNPKQTLERFRYLLINGQPFRYETISVIGVKVSEFEAEEFVAESEYKLIYYKIIIVGNKVFVVSSSAFNETIKTAKRQNNFISEAKRFLNSFSVAKSSQVQSFDLNWVKFTSEKGKFTILLPKTPEESITEIPQDYGKPSVGHVFTTGTQGSYGLNQVFYTISYSEMPVVIIDKNFINVMYENSKQSVLKRGKTLVAEKDFFYKDIKGKELITEDKDTVYHSRILLYQNKVYFIGIYFFKPLSAPQELYTQIADKYFDSFAIKE